MSTPVSLQHMLANAKRAARSQRREPDGEPGRSPSLPRRRGRRPALTFHGGVGTVTGTRFLVETSASRVLVDCGTFQGPAAMRRRNWSPVPDELHRLDAVVLTHPHLDHCGYLPALVAEGWRGPVFATPGAAELVPIALLDSAHQFVEDAAIANALGSSKHNPALPSFRVADAAAVAELLRPLAFGASQEIADGIGLEFGRSGHTLGSAWAHLRFGERSAVLCGPLGGTAHPILRPPQARPDCDTLVLTARPDLQAPPDKHEFDRFADAIRRTAARGGSVVIPAAAVDRTEVLLMLLRLFREDGRIPDVPVYLDSSAGLTALAVYQRALRERWPEVRRDPAGPLGAPTGLVELRTRRSAGRPDGSAPSIVIAGAGMATGGRVLAHLERLLPDPRNAVLLPGHAVPGTRADQLARHARQVKIHGRYLPVRAEVVEFGGFGISADAGELVAWAQEGPRPETTYLTQGEPDRERALAKRLHADEGWCAVVPGVGERVLL
ncbi:MBL fold metallo-hydrolase [Amycolatopsis sp. CA-230715]|uniref:MBL fold metallo-hydrolase n=1 Tax=Amycolatopsis sp. CA-230715 TaxID=2745196 RepID=UPI001C342903|nr:MBL fold metallo-hydrolase [Amycolatopsis sp. CA-230715]QWF77985.1 Ribonuclease [Amycolatopsis sp. CA-230715]